MHYDELIRKCIEALDLYNEKIETPDSFIEKYLLKVKHIYNK